MTQDKIALRREHVAIDGIVALASAEIATRRHRLVVDAEPGLALSAAPVRLSQALANLLTNAAKYTADGGDIRLSARRADGRIRVAVGDSGRGMNATEQRQVFDLFYQGQRGIDRADGGLGIAQTGYRQPSDIAASTAAGFEAHLVKPVDPVGLLALLEQAALPAL